MKIKLLILLAVVSFQAGVAQNAREILDKVSSTYSASPGFILTFTLNSEDTGSKTTYSSDGKAYIKGNKFKIDVPDGMTWFDGKTQWVYVSGSDEVNVTNPTGEELASISPTALLNIYKTGFKLDYKGEKKENGKQVYTIEMTPQKKGSDVTKFILKIDKTTNLFTQITVKDKNGINNVLIIRKTEKILTLADSFFVFNKKEYPDVEVIDLR